MRRGPSGTALTGAASPTSSTLTRVAPIALTMQENASVQYYLIDGPLRLGLEHFNRGNFGIAEQYVRDPVDEWGKPRCDGININIVTIKCPKQETAWGR